MATFNAFKQLGQSIVSDLRDAKDNIKAAVSHKARERKIVSEFKELLRTDPATVAKAFNAMTPKTRAGKRKEA